MICKYYIFFVLLISLAISQNSTITHTETYFNGNIKSITNHIKHGKGIRKWSHEEYDKEGNLTVQKKWNEIGIEIKENLSLHGK